MRRFTALAITLAAFVATAALPGSARAGDESAPTQGEAPAVADPQTSKVTDEELQTFVAILQDVGKIRMKYQPLIAAAESPEAAQKLQEEANADMMKTIEGHGLDVKEYSMIADAVSNDPQARERFNAVREEAMGGGKPQR